MTTAQALAVADLSFGYRAGSEELFADLSHEFRAGAVTALTGASGRGKSTLLYLLGLMLTPRRGRVLVHGRAASGLSDARRSHLRASTIGFVFQDAVLDPARTILDSIREPALYAGTHRGVATARARELLGLLGLEARGSHRPGQISGGQAQRAAVARALVNDPAIVLADEPTGNLDRDNAALVLDALAAAASQGRTVVIATHDPFVVDRANEVVQL